MSDSTNAAVLPPTHPRLVNYVVVCGALITSIVLSTRIYDPASQAMPRNALIPALFCMLGMTAIVWILMAGLRNLMVMLGKASMRYYHSYAQELPAEWIERPARTFNNLLQLPLVFYVVCLISMALDRVDASQIALAWLFVSLRAMHALIMLAWNFVPYRFAAYATSSVALATLGMQVAVRCWP